MEIAIIDPLRYNPSLHLVAEFLSNLFGQPVVGDVTEHWFLIDESALRLKST
jgi:hypothetical protein